MFAISWMIGCLASKARSRHMHLLSIGPLEFGTDDVLRKVVEARKSSEPAKRDLVVLLDTLGGYIEVVSRIVDTLRYHYDVVAFIIPNSAYSAGTVLAMSGDSIHMDYYSRLGPIDPQVESDNSEMVPALGYLKRYEKLIEGAKSEEGLSLAEIQAPYQRLQSSTVVQIRTGARTIGHTSDRLVV